MKESPKFNVFISYAKEDYLMLGELLRWLEPLRAKYYLHIFYRRYTKYDIPNAEQYPIELHSGNLYLFLTSHNSISDRNIQGKEVSAALARHAELGDEQVAILPIILSPVLWKDYSRLVQFKRNTTPKKPITKHKIREDGWVQVVGTIDKKVNIIRQNLMEEARLKNLPIDGFLKEYALPKEIAPSKMQWRWAKFYEFFWVCALLALIYSLYYVGCEKKLYPSNDYEPRLKNEEIYDY